MQLHACRDTGTIEAFSTSPAKVMDEIRQPVRLHVANRLAYLWKRGTGQNVRSFTSIVESVNHGLVVLMLCL